MSHRDQDDIAAAPLPDAALSDVWNAYLATFRRGLRAQALTEANRFVGLLGSAADHRDPFAAWACAELFDRSNSWSAQWGEPSDLPPGYWGRPIEPVLTCHPISAGILLPYLIRHLPRAGEPHLRWTYQYVLDQFYRLTPTERGRLCSAFEGRCGLGAAPIELLRLATDDPRAVHMLRYAVNHPIAVNQMCYQQAG